MRRIFIQNKESHGYGYNNDIILQIHKAVNNKADTIDYYAKLFHNQNAVKEFTFEYSEGNFFIKTREASEKEKALLIHCIQVLELSDAFVYSP